MKKPWEAKEISDAKAFGGQRVKASGNRWYSPGDVKTNQLLLDSKQTSKKSYSITLETWQKLSDEALFSFRIPMLSLKIQDTELIVLAKEDFERLKKPE